VITGAISIVSTGATFNDVIFQQNYAMSSGGAVFVSGREKFDVSMTHATFLDNRADSKGIYPIYRLCSSLPRIICCMNINI
jgi:predicted outer membrane repeat protein